MTSEYTAAAPADWGPSFECAIPESEPHAPAQPPRFWLQGQSSNAVLMEFAQEIARQLHDSGQACRLPAPVRRPGPDDLPNLILQVGDLEKTRAARRHGQGVMVASITQLPDGADDVMPLLYPYLIRTLSNTALGLRDTPRGLQAHFVTAEQGHVVIRAWEEGPSFIARCIQRLRPLLDSHMVVNNLYEPDMPEVLWPGDATTQSLRRAGQQLDSMGLLPAVFPLEPYLSVRDRQHLMLLYGIGGLSYGNLSARAAHDPQQFWMSASGVNKARLDTVGRDILLVKGFDARTGSIRLSVNPHVEPRRVSVDAIEHWMIYQQHPGVCAVVHVHAWWREPIRATATSYPCGSRELAQEVSTLLAREPDPTRAVVGLKNHGLTITGTSIADIFSRMEGRILPQVPMH